MAITHKFSLRDFLEEIHCSAKHFGPCCYTLQNEIKRLYEFGRIRYNSFSGNIALGF